MTMPDRDIEAEALDWVIRQRDDGFDGWEAFEAWLAADPTHADIYAAMAAADEDMAAVLASAPNAARVSARPVMRAQPARVRPLALATGAVAAVVIGVAGVAAWQQRADTYVVETPAGAPRDLTLADGSLLQINGGTRLVLDRHDAREISLDRGEVAVTAVHDAAQPFRVRVGDATLVDVGTVFNVVRMTGVTRVTVAEGAVVFNPGGEAVRLTAGHGLVSRDGSGQVELIDVAPVSVGSWRDGLLVYDGAPLSEVAADLSRNLGVKVAVDPSVAGRSFHGVIKLGKDADAAMARVGPLLGVGVHAVGSGWRLTSAPS